VLRKFKSALQILVVIAFVVQLAGCFYERRDDRRRHDEQFQEHHDNDRGSGIDIHVHE